jgi:hypothetical protein
MNDKLTKEIFESYFKCKYKSFSTSVGKRESNRITKNCSPNPGTILNKMLFKRFSLIL